MEKPERNGFIPADSAKKREREISREVGFRAAGRQAIRLADFHVHDGRLLDRIVILLDDRASQ